MTLSVVTYWTYSTKTEPTRTTQFSSNNTTVLWKVTSQKIPKSDWPEVQCDGSNLRRHCGPEQQDHQLVRLPDIEPSLPHDSLISRTHETAMRTMQRKHLKTTNTVYYTHFVALFRGQPGEPVLEVNVGLRMIRQMTKLHAHLYFSHTRWPEKVSRFWVIIKSYFKPLNEARFFIKFEWSSRIL